MALGEKMHFRNTGHHRSRVSLVIGLAIALAAAAGSAGTATASSQQSIALDRIGMQYHFEIIATRCVQLGFLDPKVVVAMQQVEARYEKMLAPGTNVAAVKARATPNAKNIAANLNSNAKLMCQGMANEVYK